MAEGGAFLFSGDSRGCVIVWEKRHATALKEFRSLDADVLALALSPSGEVLYATGVDSRIAAFC